MRYCTWLLFSFHGRLGRKEYFLANAGLVGVVLLGGVGALVLIPNASHTDFETTIALMSLLLLWPEIVISCKRLHDCNMRGWWQLTFVPYLLFSEQTPVSWGMWGSVIQIAASLLALFFTYMLLLRKGTDGSNKFGPEK